MVELGYKPFSGCRGRPLAVVAEAAARVRPGGVLVVRGREELLGLEGLVDLLEGLGFVVDGVSRLGGGGYEVRARLPG